MDRQSAKVPLVILGGTEEDWPDAASSSLDEKGVDGIACCPFGEESMLKDMEYKDYLRI